MPGATDHLRSGLWTAILRRRAPQWLLALAPLVLAACLLPSARPAVAAATSICVIWIFADALRWRRRINQQWPSWLNEAIPQLEDSSTLLAGEAKTPIAKLQQQRLQARLADVLTADDYKDIARQRVRFAILPLVLCLIAAASAAASPGGTRQPVTPCSTVSTGPPRSEAISGLPIACASITTRPNASGCVDAWTTTSARA